jgi:hypothetical protein
VLREGSSFDRNREIPRLTRSGKFSFTCSSDGDLHHDSTLRRDEKTNFRGNCRLFHTQEFAETWCLSVDETVAFIQTSSNATSERQCVAFGHMQTPYPKYADSQ